MKKIMVMVFIGTLVFAGCAAFNQALVDKRLSDSTPLSSGETAPAERAAKLAAPLASLPYGAGAAAVPLATLGLTWIFGWRRGRKLRIANGTSERPITGNLGSAIGVETVIQHVADVKTGILEIGAEGSVFRRFWKMLLLALPILQGALPLITQSNADWTTSVLGASIIGAAAALEKGLSKVKPLVKPTELTPA
jgi:hypothetical protein